jgi:hypothetical protein
MTRSLTRSRSGCHGGRRDCHDQVSEWHPSHDSAEMSPVNLLEMARGRRSYRGYRCCEEPLNGPPGDRSAAGPSQDSEPSGPTSLTSLHNCTSLFRDRLGFVATRSGRPDLPSPKTFGPPDPTRLSLHSIAAPVSCDMPHAPARPQPGAEGGGLSGACRTQQHCHMRAACSDAVLLLLHDTSAQETRPPTAKKRDMNATHRKEQESPCQLPWMTRANHRNIIKIHSILH